jgi:hypothetical protein
MRESAKRRNDKFSDAVFNQFKRMSQQEKDPKTSFIDLALAFDKRNNGEVAGKA